MLVQSEKIVKCPTCKGTGRGIISRELFGLPDMMGVCGVCVGDGRVIAVTTCKPLHMAESHETREMYDLSRYTK